MGSISASHVHAAGAPLEVVLFDRQQAKGWWVVFIAQITAVDFVGVGIPMLELTQCIYLVITE